MDILRGGWAPGLLGNGAGLRADSPSTGGSYQAETDAIAAAFTTPPTTARKDAIDAAVVALKTAGVWTKLDALYLFAAADSQAALINWKAPGTYNGTLVNAPAFTADSGFTGASTKYIDSNFNPTTATTPKFVQNDASIFAWALSGTGGAFIGNGTTTNGATALYPINAGNYQVGVNATSIGFITNPFGTAVGFWVASRTSSGNTSNYRNGSGTSFVDAGTASFAVHNSTTKFLIHDVNWTDGRIAAGGFGSQLSAADNTALYNALNGYLATIKIVSAFTTPPTQARQALIQNCVTSLMTAGVWDKLDALYAFAAADAQAAKVNWRNPGTFNATEVNAPAFTVDQGFTGASTKYVDTSFNPTTAITPKFTQNSASIFAHSVNSVIESGMIGTGAAPGTSGETFMMPFYTGTHYFVRVSASGDHFFVSTFGSGQGFWLASRTGSTSGESYRNGSGTSFLSTTVASAAPANASINFLNRGGQYYVGGTVATGGFGQQLSAADNTALYNALRTYLTGVGVP